MDWSYWNNIAKEATTHYWAGLLAAGFLFGTLTTRRASFSSAIVLVLLVLALMSFFLPLWIIVAAPTNYWSFLGIGCFAASALAVLILVFRRPRDFAPRLSPELLLVDTILFWVVLAPAILPPQITGALGGASFHLPDLIAWSTVRYLFILSLAAMLSYAVLKACLHPMRDNARLGFVIWHVIVSTILAWMFYRLNFQILNVYSVADWLFAGFLLANAYVYTLLGVAICYHEKVPLFFASGYAELVVSSVSTSCPPKALLFSLLITVAGLLSANVFIFELPATEIAVYIIAATHILNGLKS